jgi:hypothetical protein
MSTRASVTDAFSWLSTDDDRTDPKHSPTPSTDDDVGVATFMATAPTKALPVSACSCSAA